MDQNMTQQLRKPPLRRRLSVTFIHFTALVAFTACVEPPEEEEIDQAQGASTLTPSLQRQRAGLIRDIAARRGITNAGLIAGLAMAETQLAHCWSELTWTCKGPASSSCGGGPVIAGAGDGPCAWREGGLGMFQFDAGNYDQTLAREGRRILGLEGNIDAGLDFILEMIVSSNYVPGVSNKSQAINWLNHAHAGTEDYKRWIQTVTHHYNGCAPGRCSIYWSRYDHYDRYARQTLSDYGQGFWRSAGGGGSGGGVSANLKPMEVYWSRQSDGRYQLRALAPTEVTRVTYRVDGIEIAARVPRDDPNTSAVENNFPASYRFNHQGAERKFEVVGLDNTGKQIALGVGLLDVTSGAGVFIRQLGAGYYDIGLERAPDGVAFIQVEADGYLLRDGVSGSTRPSRLVVRTHFSQVGARSFALSTFNSDGSLRGTLRRTFTLR